MATRISAKRRIKELDTKIEIKQRKIALAMLDKELKRARR